MRPLATTPGALRVGLVIPHWTESADGRTPSWQEIAEIATRAEEIGVASLWTIDDLLIRFDLDRQPAGYLQEELEMVGGREQPLGFWECWTLLGALAAVTSTAELGQLITNNNFRAPALLAKMADTVDAISGGRVVLGLGAGNNEAEHVAFGLPWSKRFDRFEEAVPIVHSLLRTGAANAVGPWYQVRDAALEPRSRDGGPPIMIGGRGPRVLRLAARYADVWNIWVAFTSNSVGEVAQFQDALDDACREVGRDPATITRSACVAVSLAGRPVAFGDHDMTVNAIAGSPEEIARSLAAFARIGIGHLQVFLAPATVAGVETLGPVLDALEQEPGVSLERPRPRRRPA